MERLGLPRLKFVNPNIKALISPAVAVTVMVFLFIFLFQNGYSRISQQMAELKAAVKNETTLKEKDSVLREVKSALGSADKVVVALPYKNPGLWMLSQLRGAAAANSVIMSKISLANEAKFGEDLTKMEIVFGAEASGAESLASFLKAIDGLAPVSTIDNVVVEAKKEQNTTAEIKLSVFWSELPTTLPPITSPIKELTLNEQELLNKTSTLSVPQFTTFSPSEPALRDNPFD